MPIIAQCNSTEYKQNHLAKQTQAQKPSAVGLSKEHPVSSLSGHSISVSLQQRAKCIVGYGNCLLCPVAYWAPSSCYFFFFFFATSVAMSAIIWGPKHIAQVEWVTWCQLCYLWPCRRVYSMSQTAQQPKPPAYNTMTTYWKLPELFQEKLNGQFQFPTSITAMKWHATCMMCERFHTISSYRFHSQK